MTITSTNFDWRNQKQIIRPPFGTLPNELSMHIVFGSQGSFPAFHTRQKGQNPSEVLHVWPLRFFGYYKQPMSFVSTLRNQFCTVDLNKSGIWNRFDVIHARYRKRQYKGYSWLAVLSHQRNESLCNHHYSRAQSLAIDIQKKLQIIQQEASYFSHYSVA